VQKEVPKLMRYGESLADGRMAGVDSNHWSSMTTTRLSRTSFKNVKTRAVGDLPRC